MRGAHDWHPAVRRIRPWRALLTPYVLAAALAAPGAASPYSLDALLKMPLERLLQLQVAPRRAALGEVPSTPVARAPMADKWRPHAA